MNKLSVIIPTYNNEKMLYKCIKSVVNQTYNNIEIIIVDDGSIDNTHMIISKFDNYKNIIYIRQDNSGVSSARNNGIKRATGDYIMFLDSDDYYSFDYCERMINGIINNSSDICISGINYIYQDQSNLKDFYKETKIFEKKDFNAFFKRNMKNYSLYPVWNKIYSKKVLGNIVFDSKVKVGEDYIFNLEYLKNCKKICYIPNNYYNYIISQSNTTSSLNKYNKILTLENEINYMTRVDRLLESINISKKIIDKRRKWNCSLSFNKICKNIFASGNPYTIEEKKKKISELLNSKIGSITRNNICSKLFILSYSKVATYMVYSIKCRGK